MKYTSVVKVKNITGIKHAFIMKNTGKEGGTH